jgi:hypothetical protein
MDEGPVSEKEIEATVRQAEAKPSPSLDDRIMQSISYHEE